MEPSNNYKQRINHFEVTQCTRTRNKIQIKKRLLDFNSFLNSMGLALSPQITIIIQKKNPLNEASHFKFRITKEESVEQPSHEEKVLKTLGIVDATYISDRKYKTLRKELGLGDSLPTLYQLKLMKSTFKDFFELEKNNFGYFLKYPLKKVEFVLNKIFNEKPYLKETDTIVLKLCGDGKSITRSNIEINNIAFTVINDKDRCKTSVGNYILGKY